MTAIKPLILPVLSAVALAGCGPGASLADTGSAQQTGTESAEVQPTAAGRQPEACLSGQLRTPGFAGGWNVDNGEAHFGGHVTREGTNDITLRDSNGGLTMTISGFPTVRLQRLGAGQRDWDWPTGPNVSVTGHDVLLVYGCASQADMARFTGQARIDSEGASGLATFRLIMVGPNEGVLHWEIGPPMSSAGLFTISRAE